MQTGLSILLVFILLVSGGLGQFFDNLAQLVDFATVHPGEQTAQLLPPDTDIYFTINLRPGLNQLDRMKVALSHWLDNPGIKSQAQDLMNKLELEQGISIQNDILPWLGPELAMGIIQEPEPLPVVIVGTFDRTKSDAFLFNKLLPILVGGSTPWPGPSGTYRGIDTLYSPYGDAFWAFTDDYIILSTLQSRLEAVLDLYLDGGASLATTANFQAARANLPTERLAMAYININHTLTGISSMNANDLALWQAAMPYLPSFAAGSAYFVDDGTRTDYYTPTPVAMVGYPFPGQNPLTSAKIVPANALGFFSDQNFKSLWDWVKPTIVAKWAEYKEISKDPAFPAALDEWLGKTKIGDKWFPLGFNWEQDVLSWMNGEISFAVMPFIVEGPDLLMMIEVDDPVLVQGKLTAIIDGWNQVLIKQGKAPLVLANITVGGRDAVSISHPDFGPALSPSYAFINIDSSDYLVVSLTNSALAAAIDAVNNPAHSLAQNGNYQWMLNSLPPGKVSFGYIDLRQVMNFPKALAPASPAAPVPMPVPMEEPVQLSLPELRLPALTLSDGGEGTGIPELIFALLGPLHSLGMSETMVDSQGISGAAMLRFQRVGTRVYLEPTMVFSVLGDKFTVKVSADEVWRDGVGNVSSAEFHLAFNPDKMEVVDADSDNTNGIQIKPILPEGIGDNYAITMNLADNSKGLIDYAITLGEAATVFPGAQLAAITFHSKARGGSSIIFLNPNPAEPPVKLADSAGAPIAVMWQGNHVRQYRLPNIDNALSMPQMISVLGMFKGNVGPQWTNFIVEAHADLGITSVTANLTGLLLEMLPADLAIPPDKQKEWQEWLSYLEKWQLWYQGGYYPYPKVEIVPKPAPGSVFSRQLSLWELMGRLPWFLGDNNAEQVMAKLRLGNFSIPVTVRDRIGNKVTSSISLTVVDFMNPVKKGWNLLSVPVRLDDRFTTWQDIFNLGDGLRSSDAIRFDPELGWVGIAPDYRLKPLEAIYVYATENDQIGSIFARNPTAPPMRNLALGWNLVGLAISPVDWDSMAVNKAMVSVEQDINGLRGYSIVVSPSRQFDYGQDYRYQDKEGRTYYFGGYGWNFKQEPWVYAVGYRARLIEAVEAVPPVIVVPVFPAPPTIPVDSAEGKNMKVSGGYWVFMEHPDTLAGFSTTPITIANNPPVVEPGRDLWGIVDRYDWEKVTRTLYEEYSADGTTKIYLKYSGDITPSRVFEFYQQRMPQLGWKLTAWEGQAYAASLTFHKELWEADTAPPTPLPPEIAAGAILDSRIDVYQYPGSQGEISIRLEVREPGVDLPDVSRFDWQLVFMTLFERTTDASGNIHTRIRYQGNFKPDEVYWFYLKTDSMYKYGWRFVSGELQTDRAFLIFQRATKDGKTYSVRIGAENGIMVILHDQFVGTPPSVFYGYAFSDGNPVPKGTPVSARTQEVWVAGTTTGSRIGMPANYYFIMVAPDNPATTEVEGGVEWSPVIFKVGELTATETWEWHAGKIVRLDLHATQP